MNLDIRTILIVTFFHSTLIGLGLLITARDYSSLMRKSMLAWGYGLYLVAISWIFIGLREVIPDLLSIVVGNTCGLLGLAELYQSIRLFDGRPANRGPLYAIIAAAITVTVIFYLGVDSFPMRVMVVSSMSGVLLTLSGWRLLHPKAGSPVVVRLLTGLGFWVLAALWLVRSVHAALFQPDMASLLISTPLQMWVFGGTYIGTTAVTLGYLSMSSSQLNAELKQMAIIDSLSGLYNRRAMIEFAEREIARAHRSQDPLALIIIDIDGFKPVNDTHGHGAGDAAIKAMADIFKQTIRSGDVIGRIGGDEFVVLLPNTRLPEAEQIARRLALNVEAGQVIYKDKTIRFNISTGVALLGETESDYDEFLYRADQALYAAKQVKRQKHLSGGIEPAGGPSPEPSG